MNRIAEDVSDVVRGNADTVENTGDEVRSKMAADEDQIEDEAILSSTLFYICVGVVAGVVIVVVVVAVICYLLVCTRPRRDHVRHSRFGLIHLN